MKGRTDEVGGAKIGWLVSIEFDIVQVVNQRVRVGEGDIYTTVHK